MAESGESRDHSNKYPDYCKTITITDSSGHVKELVLPRSLDLDRPKRLRTTFSEEQLRRLEVEFHRNQYLVGADRQTLASRLGLTETQVKVWYQNRRTKFKRDLQQQHQQQQQRVSSSADLRTFHSASAAFDEQSSSMLNNTTLCAYEQSASYCPPAAESNKRDVCHFEQQRSQQLDRQLMTLEQLMIARTQMMSAGCLPCLPSVYNPQ